MNKQSTEKIHCILQEKSWDTDETYNEIKLLDPKNKEELVELLINLHNEEPQIWEVTLDVFHNKKHSKIYDVDNNELKRIFSEIDIQFEELLHARAHVEVSTFFNKVAFSSLGLLGGLMAGSSIHEYGLIIGAVLGWVSSYVLYDQMSK